MSGATRKVEGVELSPAPTFREPSHPAADGFKARVMLMQTAAGNRATTQYLARVGVLARQQVQPQAEIEIKIGSPTALVIPPDDGCEPRIAAADGAESDDFGEKSVVAGSSTVGPELDTPADAAPATLAAVHRGRSPTGVLARQPAPPSSSGSPPAGSAPSDPCADAVPAGSISDYERDIRDGKVRINGVVLDPETEEVIGYYSRSSGFWQVLDREGNRVDSGEPGIEAPLLDPIDFIPTPGAVVKGAAVIGKIGLKVFGKFTAKEAGQGILKIGAVTLPKLRRTSIALFGRAARSAGRQLPRIARELTEAELNHSFDRHAADWFGRAVTRGADFTPWKALLEVATQRGRRFAWSLRGTPTVAHLWKTESGYLVVQFSTEAGNELMSAFRPRGSQLQEMLKLVRLAGE